MRARSRVEGVFRGSILLDGVAGSLAGTAVEVRSLDDALLALTSTDGSGAFSVQAEVHGALPYRIYARPLRASHLTGMHVVYLERSHVAELFGTLAGGDVYRVGAVTASSMTALMGMLGEDASEEYSDAWYADLDHDGTVTENDLQILVRGFGKSAGADAWIEA